MEEIDPSLTVKDLFQNGPICFHMTKIHGVGNKARVGVDAPLGLRVLRGELVSIIPTKNKGSL